MTADISAHSYVPIVIGLLIGGLISAIVTWRGMKPAEATAKSGDASSQDIARTRSEAMNRVAAIYAPIAFLCFAVAVFDGVGTFIVLAGINALIGVCALVLARRLAVDARREDARPSDRSNP